MTARWQYNELQITGSNGNLLEGGVTLGKVRSLVS